MSTRSHIIFTDGDEVVQTYKHHDGYPSNIIPLLRDFEEFAGARMHDLEYTIANWFYYAKRVSEKRAKERDLGENESREFPYGRLTGFGLCEEHNLHGDVEHVYVVDTDNKVMYHAEAGHLMTYLQEGPSAEEVVKTMKLEDKDYVDQYILNRDTALKVWDDEREEFVDGPAAPTTNRYSVTMRVSRLVEDGSKEDAVDKFRDLLTDEDIEDADFEVEVEEEDVGG